MKLDKELRGWFVPVEAEDAGGLSPAKDDNEGWRKSDRKDCRIFMRVSYYMTFASTRARRMKVTRRTAATMITPTFFLPP